MVTFNKHTTLVVWIFFLSKLNGRQRDKFFQSHGTLRVKNNAERQKLKKKLSFTRSGCYLCGNIIK